MHIAILYFQGCPHHTPTVELVKQVATDVGIQADIEEVEITSPEEVEQYRFLGSPTVLVDGINIEPEARKRTDYSYSCRVYNGVSGLPSEAMVLTALQS